MAEYFDIVDENGEPTGEVTEREYAHTHGVRHRTSHLWLVGNRKGKLCVLLQKRSKNKDSFPDCYDISSAGHIPAGDGYRQSAVRELREELGISAREDELIYCGDRKIAIDSEFHGKAFCDRQCSRVFMLWCDLEESDFVLQEEEVESVRWIPLEECIEGVRSGSLKSCIAMEELEILASALEREENVTERTAKCTENSK